MKRLPVFLALVCLALLWGCGGGSSSTSNSGGGEVVLQTIQITPGAPTIAAGLGQQFTATGEYSDHSTKNLTNVATWNSSNPGTAIVSNSGMATAKAVGSTTITAAYSGVSGGTTLTVTAAQLVSLAVAPATATLPLGETVQMEATGTFTDGSMQNMTATVQWTSANPAAVGINVNGTPGLAQGTAVGSSAISATSGNISASANVTVTSAVLSSLAVTPATASIANGTTVQFTATGTFSDGSTQNMTASVAWTAANPSVASMNANGAAGLAMGKAAGSTAIYASSGSISASAMLTVTNATLTSITVTPANPSIPLGTLQQFTATGTFSDGSTQDITGTVAWSSSKSGVASITASGLATGLNLGSTTIMAAWEGISGTTVAEVNAADLASLAILPGNTTIAETTSEQFEAIGTFNDGSTRNLTAQSSWSSSNTQVAKIGNESGLAKGLSPGSVMITAALGTVSASVTLTVTNATLESISVTPVGRTIAPTTQLEFTATGTFSDGSTQVITRDVTWASDNTAVATIAPVAEVTGVGAGTADISATLDGVTGSTPLNVSSATLTSIAVTPATAVLAPASSLACSATGTFSDGSTQSITTAVTWSSSSGNVASVDNMGEVTGQSAGTATISAQLDSVTGSAAFVVDAFALVSIQITPDIATIAQQTATQFSATGTFADGSTEDLTGSAGWTSQPVSVATVSDVEGTKGWATGLEPGTATITAVFAGAVGTATLTVSDATLVSLTIAPTSASIPLGGTQQFSATGNFSDGSVENLTTQVSWNSSNVNVATIAGDGLASSVATGTTTITASMNGVSASTGLTVYP